MGFGLVIVLIHHSKVISAPKCNTLTDSHTTNHSAMNLLSDLSLVFTLRFLAADISASW
jgi:hypothetical protein